jgi:hypothetical protein
MAASTLRPLLLLLAGAAFGSLITFGLLNRQASVQTNQSESQGHAEKSDVPLAAKQGEDQPHNAAARSADSEEDADSAETSNLPVQAALQAEQQQHVPMRPLPKPTMAFQANGLPVGVNQDAGNSEVYARLPGVQPPLINRDGRDLGPEALQMIQTPHADVPFPGGTPDPSATPMPFPGTAEEANRQAQSSVSPSPAQQ